MTTILPSARGPWDLIGESIGHNLSQNFPQAIQEGYKQQVLNQQMNQRRQAVAQKFGPEVANLPEYAQKAVIDHILEMQNLPEKYKAQYGAKSNAQLEMLQKLGLSDVFSPQENASQAQSQPQQGQQQAQPSQGAAQEPLGKLIPEEKIAAASLVNPALADKMQKHNDNVISERRHREVQEKQKFENERTYHSGYSKDLEKSVNNIRSSLPKKEMALNFARNAVETGDLSYFSPDKLADATGIDLFRTSKGAQLITAGKENLLSNMSRVGAKAQNIWFEQRLNSMFAKIGQDKEANLTTQEMLEGEVALDRAYVDAFDKMSSDDEQKYGFVKKDISKRVDEMMKPLEKEIFKRTTYRMKEVEEQEKGLPKLKSEVGKNVSRGTPLTLSMAKLYKNKFGDKALKEAEKNGYYIPTIEEFKIFQQTPQENREGIPR